MRMSIMVNIIALTVFAAAPAHATPLWQLILRKQMKTEQHCSTEHFSNILVRQVGDQTHLAALVHCDDGRTFQVEWDVQEHHFVVRPGNSSPTATEPTPQAQRESSAH